MPGLIQQLLKRYFPSRTGFRGISRRKLNQSAARERLVAQSDDLEPRLLLSAYTWQGGSDGNIWASAANWFNEDLGQTNRGVPGSADSATISHSPNVVLNANVSVDHLALTPTATGVQVYTGANTLTTNGGKIESGDLWGNFINNGTFVIDVAGGAVGLGTGAPYGSGSLTNNGTIDLRNGVFITAVLRYGWLSPFNITNSTSAEIRMADGTKFDAQAGASHIFNSGTIRKTSTNGTATTSASITNETSGVIDVDGGKLVLSGVEHTLGGMIEIAPGATLEDDLFGTGDIDISTLVTVTGGGTWRHTFGKMTFSGGTIQSSDTQFLVQADSGADASSATIRGTGTFDVADMKVVKGRLGVAGYGTNPSSNIFTNNGSILFAGQGTDHSKLAGATLINNASVTIHGVTNGFSLEGAALDNRSGGTVTFAADASVNGAYANGVGPSFVKNSGTIVVDSTVTTVVWPGMLFQNRADGVLDVRAGTLDLSSIRNWSSDPAFQSYSTGGHFIVAAGAVLNLVSPSSGPSSPVFAGRYTGAGGGQVRLGNNWLAKAVLDFPTGLAQWSAGQFFGAGTNVGSLTVGPDNSPYPFRSVWGEFTNDGTMTFAPGVQLQLNIGGNSGPGLLTNRATGVIEFTNGGDILGWNSGTPSDNQIPYFLNEGTLKISAGSVSVRPKFDNLGTVEVIGTGNTVFWTPRPTTLAGAGASTLPGIWTARNGGVIDFQLGSAFFDSIGGSVSLIGAGSTFSGLDELRTVRGSLSLTGGATWNLPASLTNEGKITLGSGSRLGIATTYTQTGNGILTTRVGGTTQFGQLAVTGAATLGGTLVTGLEGGFQPLETDRFDVVTSPTISGLFGDVQINALAANVTATTVTLGLLSAASDIAVENVLLSGVSGPLNPGDSFQVQYTVRNLSDHAVTGPWSDLLFLSQDSRLDSRDFPVARSAATAGLPAFGAVTLTETISAPNRPGRWFVITAADAAAVVFDLNRRNNAGSSSTPIQIPATILSFGVNVPSDVPSGQPVYYELHIPAGTSSVRVMTTFPDNDAGELRIRRGSLPDNSTGDTVAYALPSGANRVASITLDNAVAGTYYVSVISRTAGVATTRADDLSLSLTGIENEGSVSPQLIAGDSLSVTVRGTGFTNSTQFRLGTLNASQVTILSPSKAVATFSGLTQGGPFQISAVDGGTPVIYSGKAFTVIAAGTNAAAAWARLANWQIEVNVPQITRPFREIPVIVNFRNTSSMSQPAPLIQLTTDNGVFRLDGETDYGSEFALVLGVKSSGRPDLYAPGESGSVRLYVYPKNKGLHVFTKVAAAAATENDVASQPGAGGAIFPLETALSLPADFVDSLRPDTISLDAWTNAVRPSLVSLVGGTIDTWAAAIRNAAMVLSRDGIPTLNPSRAIAYLLQQADRFGTIHQRFELTAFGHGIENPLDSHAVTDVDGNVKIVTGFNMRPFQKQGGSFVGVTGDRGQLGTRVGGGYLLTEVDGTVTAFAANGTWEYTESRLGVRTTANYSAGRLTTITDHFGDVTTLTYNGNGRIDSITDPVGRVTTYTYDASERLTSITDPLGITSIEWNPDTTGAKAWTQSALTTSDGVRTEFAYDAQGRSSQQSFAGGVQPVSISYGTGINLGKVTSTDAASRSSTWLEGEFGQITELTEASGRFTDLSFDRTGRVISVRTGSQNINIERDAFGNVVQTTSPAGNDTSLEYDSTGVYPESLINSEGQLTNFVNSDRNLLTQQIDASGRSEFFGYDVLGNRLFRKSEGGKWSLDTVDSENLVTRREFSDGSRLDFAYDAHRNLTTVVETPASGAPRTVSLTYDVADRVTRVTYPGGRFVNYRYDAQGRQDQISTSDGLVTDYTFDSLSRLSIVSRNSIVQVTYAYDSVGRVASKVLANGASTHYNYDNLDRVTRIEHRDNTNAIIGFNEYVYDANDRIVSMTDAVGMTSYVYDLDGQLIQTTLPDGTVIDYSVDSVGNRTAYTVNSLNQYLTGPNGEQFQYDGDGNLVTVLRTDGTSISYGYDGRNRVTSITDSTERWQFEYDPLGNRSAVVHNGVRSDLLIDAVGGVDGLSDVLAEYNGVSQTASYVIGDGLEAMFTGAGVGSYYLFDNVGNTSALTAEDGSVSASYRYLPFGEILSSAGTGVASNQYTFNGEWGVAQRGTAGFDMRARLYDSVTGRFTQQDPIGFEGGDVNLYRVVLNDPVALIDPGGLDPVDPSGSIPVQPVNPAASTSGAGTRTPPRGRPPRGPRPRVPRVNPGAEAGVADGVVLSGERAGAKGLGPLLNGLKENFKRSEGVAAVTKIAGTGMGGVARILTGPVGIGLSIIDPAGAADEFSMDYHYRERLIRTQMPLHPLFGAKLAELIARRGSYYSFDELIEVLQCVRQRERAEGINEQRTPGDPNEIFGPAGFDTPGYLTTPAVFPYTIYFQNVPTASVPAQEVFVTQQLDSDLDWDSFELTRFGWGSVSVDVPAGLKSYQTRVNDSASGLVVDVSAIFNSVTGELSWTFRSLDPVTFDLPWDGLAGFLPPDDTTGRGQGFVGYSIQPKQNAADGTEFTGQASIVFDTEAPILTNTWLNTLDSAQPASTMSALPAVVTTVSFPVTWSGSDGTGSGIAFYDVYVSVNNSPYALWQTSTTSTSANYTGQSGETYRFYSVATDNVGHEQSSPVAAQSVTTVNALSSVITAPTATTQLMRPTIQWTAVVGVTAYDLWITNRSTGQDPLIRTLTQTPNTEYTPSQDLGFGNFRVWVRGQYSDGTYTVWSPKYDFSVNNQAVIRPLSTSPTTGFPTIEWSSIPGAAKYDLWIDNLSTGQSQFIRKTDVLASSFIPQAELPLGRYRAWVRAIDANNHPAMWSTAAYFTVLTPPLVISPALSTFSTTPQFAWNAVPGATEYEIWIDSVTAGVSPYIREQSLASTTFTPAASMPAGNYKMWVRAIGPGGLIGRYSTGQMLNVGGIPVIAAPAGVLSDTSPLITWTPVDGASRYDLWIDRIDVPQSQIVRAMNLTVPQFETPILPLGTYRAWVRAFQSGNSASVWSRPVAFSIDIADASTPTLLALPVSTFNTTPTIAWTAMPGATRYELFVRNLATLNTAIFETNIPSTSFTPLSPLAVGSYRVWMRAYVNHDVLGDYSAPLDFDIEAASEDHDESLILEGVLQQLALGEV